MFSESTCSGVSEISNQKVFARPFGLTSLSAWCAPSPTLPLSSQDFDLDSLNFGGQNQNWNLAVQNSKRTDSKLFFAIMTDLAETCVPSSSSQLEKLHISALFSQISAFMIFNILRDKKWFFPISPRYFPRSPHYDILTFSHISALFSHISAFMIFNYFPISPRFFPYLRVFIKIWEKRGDMAKSYFSICGDKCFRAGKIRLLGQKMIL
jgi:hypothetical protein